MAQALRFTNLPARFILDASLGAADHRRKRRASLGGKNRKTPIDPASIKRLESQIRSAAHQDVVNLQQWSNYRPSSPEARGLDGSHGHVDF